MMIEQTKCIGITYLYHDKEELFYNTLNKHIVDLYRQNIIREIKPAIAGEDYQENLKQRLKRAQIIVLIVSSDFNGDGSEYSKQETVDTIKGLAENGTRIWPIIARPVYWEITSYAEFDFFFGTDKLINDFQRQEDAYVFIARKIKQGIDFIYAQERICEGNRYRHQRKLEQALAAYESSLFYVPGYPCALLEKGRTLRQQGKMEEAKNCFELITVEDISSQLAGKARGNRQPTLSAPTCDKGYAFLELGKLDEAHNAFKDVYQQIGSPVSYMQKALCAEAYCGEGDICLLLSQQPSQPSTYAEQALKAYRQAKMLAPKKPKYMMNLGKAHRVIGDTLGPGEQGKDHYEQALYHYEQVIQLFPNHAPAHSGRGDALTRLGRREEALAAYEATISLDQDESHAYGERGWLFLQRYKGEKALENFNKALDREGGNIYYLYGQGRALALLERYQEALDVYECALNKGLNAGDFFMHRGDVLLALGEIAGICNWQEQMKRHYNAALLSYKAALQQGMPQNIDQIYIGLGTAYIALGQLDQACQQYQRAIDEAAYKPDGYLGMGRTLFAQGHVTEASKFLEWAQRCFLRSGSTSEMANLYLAYGDIYSQLAGSPGESDYYTRQQEAQSMYQESLKFRKHFRTYFSLGKTYVALHNYQEAMTALQHALKLCPRLAEGYFIYGKCCYEQGQYAEAITSYKKALAYGFAPMATLRIAQGEALLAMKNYFEARIAFEEVITQGTEEAAQASCGRGMALYGLRMIEESVQSFLAANQCDIFICTQTLLYRQTLESINSLIEGQLYTDPLNASMLKLKGEVLLLLKRSKDAVDAYTKAITYGERSADVYYGRGEAYTLLQMYHRSFKDYQKALRIDPNHRLAQQRQADIKTLPYNFISKITFWWAIS